MKVLNNITLCGLVMLALLASLVACNKEPVGTLPDGQALIAFNSSVTETKATIDDLKNNHFQVWGGYADKVVFNGVEVRDTLGNSWTYNNHENTYWTNDAYNFYAIYPKSLATSPELANGGGISYDANTKSFTISNYNIKDSDLDLLIATVEDHKYEDVGTTVPLNFRHAFAQVSFQAKKDANAGEIIINNISLYGLPALGTYSSISGEWSFDAENYSDQSNPFVSNSSQNVDNTFKDVLTSTLVFPTLISTEFKVTLSYTILPSDTQTVTSQIATVTEKWEPGKKYVYTFTIIDPNTIIFDPPKVRPWTESSGNVIIVE